MDHSININKFSEKGKTNQGLGLDLDQGHRVVNLQGLVQGLAQGHLQGRVQGKY
jgi:hypothetical protein